MVCIMYGAYEKHFATDDTDDPYILANDLNDNKK